MTIFGFNTNVQRDEVTYHVESQARPGDLLLQTMIFVKGQCLAKHAFSYAAMTIQSGFSEELMHGLLKAQHKNVIDALQRDPIAKVLVSPAEIPDVGGSGLAIKWSNAGDQARDNQVVLRLQVLDSGTPVGGAIVVIRPYPPGDSRGLAESLSDSSGSVELVVPVTAGEPAVIAQASHGGKSATRKLRLKN